jgi:signal peptidase I
MNLMKKLERITTGLSIAILAVCCVALLVFGISLTGWKALSIPTGSMRPAIPPGSLVLVHRVSISSLKVGDVITYINPMNPKTTLSHRIVKKYLINNKIPAFVTKGDANKTTDVPITEGSVEGKVVMRIPKLGYWLIDAKRPIIILPIVYLAAIIVMAEEVIRLRDYFKLGQPYILHGYEAVKKGSKALGKRLALGSALTIAMVMVLAAAGPTAFALLRSNTVSLINNSITVAPISKTTCSGSNSNSVTVNNSTTQSSSSGNASSAGSGNATSGNASNSSSSSVTVTATNC